MSTSVTSACSSMAMPSRLRTVAWDTHVHPAPACSTRMAWSRVTPAGVRSPYSSRRAVGVSLPPPSPTTRERGTSGAWLAVSSSRPRLMARLGFESVSMATTRLPRAA